MTSLLYQAGACLLLLFTVVAYPLPSPQGGPLYPIIARLSSGFDRSQPLEYNLSVRTTLR